MKEFTAHSPADAENGWLVLHWVLAWLREVTRDQVRTYCDMFRDCYSLVVTMGVAPGVEEIERHLEAARSVGAAATYADLIQNMYTELSNVHSRYALKLERWETFDPSLSKFANVLEFGLNEFLRDVKRVESRVNGTTLIGQRSKGSAKVVTSSRAFLVNAALVDDGGVEARAAAVNTEPKPSPKKAKAAVAAAKGGAQCTGCKEGRVKQRLLDLAKARKWTNMPALCDTCYGKKQGGGAKVASASEAKGGAPHKNAANDWKCTEGTCSYLNFSWRTACFKCKATKPGGAPAKAKVADTETELASTKKQLAEATAKLAGGSVWNDD
jgi:hypothetical protein